MKKILFVSAAILLLAAMAFAADRGMTLSDFPDPAVIGQKVTMTCLATGDWRYNRITSAKITIWNASGTRLVNLAAMSISGKTATYNYTINSNQAPGNWRFQCLISDGGNSLTQSRQFTVTSAVINRAPVANAGGPYTGTAGQSVSFNGAGSSDPDGNPLTYSWNFGDNGTGTGVSPSHTYAAAGTFTVTLTVNDGKGGANSSQTTATIAAVAVSLTGLTISGPGSVVSNTNASYTATAAFSNGTTQNVTSVSVWSENSSYATIGSGGVLTASTVTSNQSVTVSATYSYNGTAKTATLAATITPAPVSGPVSITSTSQNRASIPAAPVPQQTFTTKSGYNVFAANDLGMHCADLDHRVASILPPYNVLHAQVIQKGTSTSPPKILTSSNIGVVYSAASNPKDPALANPASAPVYKTNFWDDNPAFTGNSLAFDGYNPFYPPNILDLFPLTADMALPAPDLNLLYPVSGSGSLAADQQNMPGISAPYTANVPQSFNRFDKDFPFFINFPFGYRQTEVNWFAADGIPIAPVDDFGRANAFPLFRVQAKTTDSALTGVTGDTLASTDTVAPVSAEASCTTCHTSSVDGGNGQAAAIPGADPGAAIEGSPRSGTPFSVVTASDDISGLPGDVKKEWAADTNIIRLHDAKIGANLTASQPVVCQRCHYSPALDLAQAGPVGPGDANANGREQKIHHSNSRALHEYHSQFTDLFASMPGPTDSRRLDPATGKPTVNSFVQTTLDQSCYRCHPGQKTQCQRGAMKTAGLICQDCHGSMAQVGNDFTANFSASTPFPAGADLTKRVPWASVPKCQSCHTGDAMSSLNLTDPNVIKSKDGLTLLQAYRTNDPAATPIMATNARFMEETASNGKSILYRLSTGHGGLSCESCHGSTHAEWPVTPESGTYIANDNMAAIQLQGHTGKITECTACHAAGSLSVSLGGPHGMHQVGDTNFLDGHNNLYSGNRAQCQACHGQNGQGTTLSKAAVNRTLSVEDGRTVSLTKGQMVSCNLCHSNPI
ncbi:MAG: PKD domain-containing protein [Desulfobacteraceae bacterium]|nr:PKD domain-containing protein [Desulfobacteraceae bacterium]